MRLVTRNFNRPTSTFLPSLWNELLNDDLFYAKNKKNACAPARKGLGHPAVNIRNTEAHYFIEVAAPGFAKADFSVELEKDLLTISAEKELSKEDEKEGYTHKEFVSKAFKRSFTIPQDSVAIENIGASYEAGVLTVSIPKKEVEVSKLSIDIS